MPGITVVVIDIDKIPGLGAEAAHDVAHVLGATASFTASTTFGNNDLSRWTVVKNLFGVTDSGLRTAEMLQRVAEHIYALRIRPEWRPGPWYNNASELIVGTGVFVVREGPGGKMEFLLGKRTDTCRRGAGCWALPGGICEMHETVAECAAREVLEETGLEVHVVAPHKFNRALPYCLHGTVPCLAASDHRPREPHVSFWMVAEYKGGEPRVAEPDKCTHWRWADLHFIESLGPDVLKGEQQYWTPLDLWRQILPPIGFEEA